jgi:hypothetical protein
VRQLENMAKAIEHRLRALEQHLSEQLTCMKYEQLMASANAGLLKDANFSKLTDEQLWWLIAGREEPIPDQERT